MLENMCEHFEQIQLFNTLGTVYLFRGDLNRALSYVKRAIPLTIGSKEYHIYSLINLSLLFKLFRKKEKASQFFERAVALARKGDNLFALKQIEHTYSMDLPNR